MVAAHLIAGKQAEQAVCQFLKQQKLSIICTNFACKAGEIDIIAKDKETIVFIEVRLRTNKQYGDGLTSVTSFKQQKIRRAATVYLLQKNLYEKIPVRIDVIAVNENGQFDWVKNAF